VHKAFSESGAHVYLTFSEGVLTFIIKIMEELLRRSWVLICRFRSPNSNRLYEVKLSSEGTLGCNCPGWTKRVRRIRDASGTERVERGCKHTQWVEEHLRLANGAYCAQSFGEISL